MGDASSMEVEVGGSGIQVILSYFVSSNQSELETLPQNNPHKQQQRNR